MPGPMRGRRAHRKTVDETDILPYVKGAASHISSYYSVYSDELSPLSDFRALPRELSALPLPNGDIVLRHSDGQEASFDVIGVIVGLCLEAPPGFRKSNFPFFRRWVKVTAVDEPFFSAAMQARQVLYNFLALRATGVLPPPQFFAGGVECYRPSAETLTSLEKAPDAIAVDIPPLYEQAPYEAAIRTSHGKFAFTADNEVLFFGDEMMDNEQSEIVRREISPSAVKVGQIVQVKMKMRLLRQDDGNFTFREVLKGVCVLHDGLSMEIARNLAGQTLGSSKRTHREVKFYTVGRSNKAQRLSGSDQVDAGPST